MSEGERSVETLNYRPDGAESRDGGSGAAGWISLIRSLAWLAAGIICMIYGASYAFAGLSLVTDKLSPANTGWAVVAEWPGVALFFVGLAITISARPHRQPQ